MRKIILGLLCLLSIQINAQVKISQMPTIIGNNTDSLWLPSLQDGINKKVRGWQLKPSVAPTWQQTLISGSILTQNNAINADQYNFNLNNSSRLEFGTSYPGYDSKSWYVQSPLFDDGEAGHTFFHTSEDATDTSIYQFYGALYFRPYSGIYMFDRMPETITPATDELLSYNVATKQVGRISQSQVSSNLWKLTGNAGTVDGTNFIGTTDDKPFNIRVNNVKAGRIQRVGENVYLGYEAGLNSTSSSNTAIGYRALKSYSLLIQTYNTAVGSGALEQSTIGEGNTAIGYGSMGGTTTGKYNTAVGAFGGGDVFGGQRNVMLGYAAGFNLETGNDNVLIGANVSVNTLSGSKNIFIGTTAGATNVSGSSNTVIGYGANLSANNFINATAIGANSYVGASNTISFGSINGVNGATSDTWSGFGTIAATERLHVVGNFRLQNGSQAVDRWLKTDANGLSVWADLPAFVVPNAAIIGATKTKITYDAKGLVTAGADATTADIAASTDKNYVTDAQQIVIGNTSGVNTGDQDLSGLQPLDADLTAISALTPSNDDIIQRKAGVWTNRTPAQFKTDLALTKADVGLGNVDNTSDANKPISTATQAALDLKLNITDAYTDEKAQDATGAMVNATLIYNDGANSLERAAISGDIQVPLGSNTATINAGVITDVNINAAANVTATKLATGIVNNTEFNYLDGVTSSIQTQFGNKVTKGGDNGAFSFGTTGAGQDLTVKVGGNDRWVFDGTNGYLRRGASGTADFGLHLFGTGQGSVIAFGDRFDASTPFVALREKGGTDVDQLEAYGQKGLYLTTGTYGSTSTITIQQDHDVIIGGETQVAGAELTIIGDEDVSGNSNIQGNLTAGNILKGSAVLNFASTAGGASSELTIAVPGAAVGDAVMPGIGTSNANSMYEYRVSAANVLSIKFVNVSGVAIDPASATFKYVIIK
ncbi:MAG: hypothetical protein IPJ81_00695 [Chitinophagaceae bacterium]|nr:hypothetical protein [Chitinophagaceae bacterium]